MSCLASCLGRFVNALKSTSVFVFVYHVASTKIPNALGSRKRFSITKRSSNGGIRTHVLDLLISCAFTAVAIWASDGNSELFIKANRKIITTKCVTGKLFDRTPVNKQQVIYSFQSALDRHALSASNLCSLSLWLLSGVDLTLCAYTDSWRGNFIVVVFLRATRMTIDIQFAQCGCFGTKFMRQGRWRQRFKCVIKN